MHPRLRAPTPGGVEGWPGTAAARTTRNYEWSCLWPDTTRMRIIAPALLGSVDAIALPAIAPGQATHDDAFPP